jgi:heme oxygenase
LNTALLPERLKRGTQDLHAEAEQSGVMGELLNGRIGIGAYCALLRNLHCIYAALEPALDAASAAAHVGALNAPALKRSPSLARDLDHLHPGPWQRDFAVEPTALAYVERLRELSAAAPHRLAAHAYVRYLGDLHGGQVLQKVVAARFGLQGAEGTRFYQFGPPAQVARLRRAFRAGLADLNVTVQGMDELVTEARWGFAMHKALFNELQQRHGGPATPAG